MTLVYYHIPTDLDDPEIPNAFAVPKTLDDISLADIIRHFPLPGTYHFRVRTNSGWLDLHNRESAPLPVLGKRIVLKVLRLAWLAAPPAAAAPAPAPAAVAASFPSFDAFDLHAPPAARPTDDFDSFFR